MSVVRMCIARKTLVSLMRCTSGLQTVYAGLHIGGHHTTGMSHIELQKLPKTPWRSFQ